LDRRLDGARAVLDAVEKRKIVPLLGIEPQPSSLKAVAMPTKLSRGAEENIWPEEGKVVESWRNEELHNLHLQLE
jgi:hypothetical protein